MTSFLQRRRFLTLMVFTMASGSMTAQADQTGSQAASDWKPGTPIVTYWAGPTITDQTARQMADGGWNVVWCRTEAELDVAQRHGLRALLRNGLISPQSLDDPAKREKLDALIGRVRQHPAFYCYWIKDEPNTAEFPALGRMVEYLRQRDPEHLAYINLFPTYARNKQLGTTGDTVAAYREYLRQFIDVVKPSLLSYDHYQFAVASDLPDYFLNLALVRQAAQEAGLPFLNIVQSCTRRPSMRVPTGDEMRYLVYTTLAYGAQGISYYVYCRPKHEGGIALADGTPTPRYHALKSLNREFTAIATELQPLESRGVYHVGMLPPGAVALPEDAVFRLDPPPPATPFEKKKSVKGLMLGFFGPTGQTEKKPKPTHGIVVNLDYTASSIATVVGPGKMEVFDATTGKWSSVNTNRIELQLPPGSGKLVRCLTPSDKVD